MLIGATLSLSFPPFAINAPMNYLVFITMTIFIGGLVRLVSDNKPNPPDKSSQPNKFNKLVKSSILHMFNRFNTLNIPSFYYGYFFYLGSVIAFIGYWFSYYFRLQLGCSHLISYALTMIICLYTSLYIGIICYIFAKLKTKSKFFNLVILFPSLWVLTELIRGQFFPRSWYALGYTQVDNYLFRGYYPLFGVYFVSWLVVAISAWMVYCILYIVKLKIFKPNRTEIDKTTNKYNTKSKLKLYLSLNLSKLLIIITSSISFIILSLILANINYTKKYGTPITIALLQPSIFSSKNYDYDTLLELENVSEQLIKHDKTKKADLIVLPETVFGTYYGNLTPDYLSSINSYLKHSNQILIFSTPLYNDNMTHSTGIVISDKLESPIYIKHHLVPFGEYNPIKDTILAPLTNSFNNQIGDYISGNLHQPPTTILGQRFAFNTCYENTINDYVADNAKSATILLNQSDLSWYGKTKMKDAFLQFSQGRALETQRYFLQDGNTGDTVVINPHGIIEASITPFTAGVLSVKVQGYSGITPFQYYGNIPIWIICITVLIIAIIIRMTKIQHN